ncbi:MAG: phytanoyl-CoA dioxygenase family protein [Verrucomicrobiota bacterium]
MTINSDLKLTTAQHNFFNTFGYLGFPGLLADRVEDIIKHFELVFTSKGGGHYGKPHDGKSRSCIVPFIDQDEYLCTLLEDPRIHGILTSLLGDDFNYMGSDGNYYVGNTNWHSDSGFTPRLLHLKIAFYLDPVGKDSGCLRVIPGSHRVGEPYAEKIQKDIWKCQDNWGVDGWSVPCVPLETKPGDIVLFNHDLKHASYHGATNRRMFTINCCQRYPETDLAALRDYIGGGARFWLDRAYGSTLVRTAPPQRQRHLEQVLANDGHLAALTAEARRTMTEPSRG